MCPGPAGSDGSDSSAPTAAFSQSLERGLQILACLAGRRSVLGIADIAREVELSKSTTHRYVATLTHLGYLTQDGETRKYSLGPRAVDLGLAAISSIELTRVAARPLQALSDETGFTVNMAVLDQADIVYVDRRRSARPGALRMELNLHVGSRLPAYCTSMGKVLLAHLDARELRLALDSTDLARRGPKTITAREQLMAELHRVRETGVAVNDEELAPGLRSVAAPVRDRAGDVVSAVNVAVHLTTWNVSLDATVARLEAPLRRATAEISHRLGYRSGSPGSPG